MNTWLGIALSIYVTRFVQESPRADLQVPEPVLIASYLTKYFSFLKQGHFDGIDFSLRLSLKKIENMKYALKLTLSPYI